MIEFGDVLGMGVALVGGIGVGYTLGHMRGVAAHRALTRPAPAPEVLGALPPTPTEYAIVRNGRRVWYGTDPHDARNWWEHQKRSPGLRVLVFTQDGVARDHFEASG